MAAHGAFRNSRPRRVTAAYRSRADAGKPSNGLLLSSWPRHRLAERARSRPDLTIRPSPIEPARRSCLHAGHPAELDHQLGNAAGWASRPWRRSHIPKSSWPCRAHGCPVENAGDGLIPLAGFAFLAFLGWPDTRPRNVLRAHGAQPRSFTATLSVLILRRERSEPRRTRTEPGWERLVARTLGPPRPSRPGSAGRLRMRRIGSGAWSRRARRSAKRQDGASRSTGQRCVEHGHDAVWGGGSVTVDAGRAARFAQRDHSVSIP
jgi:hypothetical protein